MKLDDEHMTRVKAGVIGAGSWGTALANLLAKKGIDTTIWAFEPEVAAGITEGRHNPVYLTEIALDPRLRATSSIEDAVKDANLVVSVSPSHVVRRVMDAARPHLSSDTLLVSASKGIEVETLRTMDEVLEEVLPREIASRAAFLSGPSFALEVANENPTAVTMASRNEVAASQAQELFQTDYFRVYTSEDVTGVEVGGSLKNVIAIASGVVAGLGFGHNTLAALITRGLAEMTRLGVNLGADPRTFAGLAGMGDLILTCTGSLSRNRSVGFALGQGRPIADVLAGMTMVAEGVPTTRSARDLARRRGVEMPIVEEVHSILFEDKSPRLAVEDLMLRAPKAEWW
jgi:glycerol-3-phosphate dehydrogenase (NAD(P)+)